MLPNKALHHRDIFALQHLHQFLRERKTGMQVYQERVQFVCRYQLPVGCSIFLPSITLFEQAHVVFLALEEVNLDVTEPLVFVAFALFCEQVLFCGLLLLGKLPILLHSKYILKIISLRQ